jgi:hypothetical protein
LYAGAYAPSQTGGDAAKAEVKAAAEDSAASGLQRYLYSGAGSDVKRAKPYNLYASSASSKPASRPLASASPRATSESKRSPRAPPRSEPDLRSPAMRFRDTAFYNGDWNELFLRALSMPDSVEKYEKLTQLSEDFVKIIEVCWMELTRLFRSVSLLITVRFAMADFWARAHW